MIIKEISSEDQLQHSSMFWGIKVLPEKPVAVSLPSNSFMSLHISQATIEYTKVEDITRRSLVSVNCDGEEDILICSLRVNDRDMASLKLDFHGPCEMVFSLRGPRGVHLAGYFYDYIPSSPTNLVAPPVMDNGGRGIQQKEYVLSINTPGLGIADFVGEVVKENGGTSFNIKILLPGLAESLNQIPVSLEEQLKAQSAAIIKDVIENALVNQHLIQEEKQPGEKEKTKKVENKCLPIAPETDHGDNHEGSKKRKRKKSNNENEKIKKGENKCLPIAPETDYGDNHEGSKKRKRKKSNKQLPITDEVECENIERSSVRRKLDYVLPVKEAQPADSNEKESEKKRKKKKEKKQLPEVDGAGDNVEDEKKRKKKREKKQLPEVNGAEIDNAEGPIKHDTPQTPLLDSKEDIKMKKRQRRREQKEKEELGKLIDEDDHNRSLAGSDEAIVCALPVFGKR